MVLRKSRASNFKLGNNRRRIEYECLMADLNLMGVVNDASCTRYTGHEKSTLIKEPAHIQGAGGNGNSGGGTGGAGGGTELQPVVAGTTATITVNLSTVDESAISAAIAGKETWIINATANIYNSEAVSENFKKLVDVLAARKQEGNKIQITLFTFAANGRFKIPASCFAPIKDVLTEVKFPTNDSVAEIGAAAFEGCTKITLLRTNAEVIGQRAFAGCTNLTTVHFAANVRSIGKGVFKDCPVLTDVRFSRNLYLVGDTQVDMIASRSTNAANFKTAWVEKDIVRKD